jgi:hypothetical protein
MPRVASSEAKKASRVRAGELPLDAKLAVTYELARRIVFDRGKVHDDVVGRATEAGLRTAQILEIVDPRQLDNDY